MKVSIASSGRFHALDLARELDALDHIVKFYSFVPQSRAMFFGLPRDCQISILPLMAPFVMAERWSPQVLKRMISRFNTVLLDTFVASILHPCDVFIAMSGLYNKTIHVAKNKYKAKIVVERGSRHILSQDKILREASGRSLIDPFFIARELLDYEAADLISVPSEQVLESFVEFGVSQKKIFLNPYGCDLSMFPSSVRAGNSEKVILFVGTWSLRKGCDILVQAWRMLQGVRLLHVGPVGDLSLPTTPGFTHFDSVSQEKLSAYYSEADVFVLASREEGLALVQAQALASGLPVVCTTRTGGRDLAGLIKNNDAVFEVEPDDPTALADAITSALQRYRAQQGPARDIVGAYRDRLSWHSYGVRYAQRLRDLIGE